MLADQFFEVDFADVEPLFTRPELLCHPNVPPQVGSLNPRTVLGRNWWDSVRKDAYFRNNLCCHACGAYSGDNPYDPRLQAHECYDIRYEKGVLIYKETVALDYSCHNFIHSGRMKLVMEQGEMSREQVKQILESRMEILGRAGLKPFCVTKALWYHMVGNMPWHSALIQVREEGLIPQHPSPPPRRRHWVLIVGSRVFDYTGKELDEHECVHYRGFQ